MVREACIDALRDIAPLTETSAASEVVVDVENKNAVDVDLKRMSEKESGRMMGLLRRSNLVAPEDRSMVQGNSMVERFVHNCALERMGVGYSIAEEENSLGRPNEDSMHEDLMMENPNEAETFSEDDGIQEVEEAATDEEDDDEDDEEDEEDDEDDEAICDLPSKNYQKGFSPPNSYLPLPAEVAVPVLVPAAISVPSSLNVGSQQRMSGSSGKADMVLNRQGAKPQNLVKPANGLSKATRHLGGVSRSSSRAASRNRSSPSGGKGAGASIRGKSRSPGGNLSGTQFTAKADKLKNNADKHLWVPQVFEQTCRNEVHADEYRFMAFQVYDSLAKRINEPSVLARLRRRLLRLAGHAILSHHRGKCEVIFQTAFLFDLVLTRYVSWSDQQASMTTQSLSSSGGSMASLKSFFESVSHSGKSGHMTSLSSASLSTTSPYHAGTDDTQLLSRLTTAVSITEAVASSTERIKKEELRTLLVACLILASKWNNSRYLSPVLLCSAPVGRVSLETVLQYEISILSLFDFNIPFTITPMSLAQLLADYNEESANLTPYRRTSMNLTMMLLIMGSTNYRSLHFPTRTMARSALYIADRLTKSAFYGPSSYGKGSSGLDGLVGCGGDRHPDMNDLTFRAAVQFHLENSEIEIRAALSALPRLRNLGRWSDLNDAPNVFGVPLSSRVSTSALTLTLVADGDGRTKTESLALAFLRPGTSACFDAMVAATGASIGFAYSLEDQQRKEYENWHGLWRSSVRDTWMNLRRE